MIEIEINYKNLIKFFNNLRFEDKSELKYFLKNNIKNKFIDTINKATNVYFLGMDKNTPAAIGGAQELEGTNYAQIWLLCSNNYDKKFLYKYVKNKIAEFKNSYDFLFNYIYKTNFDALKWLSKLGFKTVENNSDTKLFYFMKGSTNIDLRNFTDK